MTDDVDPGCSTVGNTQLEVVGYGDDWDSLPYISWLTLKRFSLIHLLDPDLIPGRSTISRGERIHFGHPT